MLLLPINVGGNGLNLTEATHVIFVEPCMNPGLEAQAVGRVHRIGQRKKTFVHRFIVKATIEEGIAKLSKDKEGIWESRRKSLGNKEQFTFDDIKNLVLQ